MNRRTPLLLGLVALATLFAFAVFWLASPTNDAVSLVFAPSSFAPVEAELDAGLAAAGIGPVEWAFAGSQTLVAQLVDGAPADALITADLTTFDAARAANVTWPGEESIASNVLVLAVAAGNPGDVRGLEALEDADLVIGSCAVEVPCGRLATAVTRALGVTPAPDTEETSARALTAKLLAGEIDAALVYRSDARAAGLEVVDRYDLDAFVNEYRGSGNERGMEILRWLASGAGKRILIDSGWGP